MPLRIRVVFYKTSLALLLLSGGSLVVGEAAPALVFGVVSMASYAVATK